MPEGLRAVDHRRGIESRADSRPNAIMDSASRAASSGRSIRAAVATAVFVSILAFTSTGAFAQGCAMCGTTIGSSNDPLARGIAYSIVLMLAVPNLLVACIGGWLFFVYRRAARKAAAPALPPGPGFAQISLDRPQGPSPTGVTT
jgi:hypothetical protein